MKEKQVFIKTYGWCKILKQDYKYALIQTPKGSNITYNILGLQTRELCSPILCDVVNDYIDLTDEIIEEL